MTPHVPWRKQHGSGDLPDNWVDAYAPEDPNEADYFYGRPGAVRPAEEPLRHGRRTRGLLVLLLLVLVVAGSGYLAYTAGRRSVSAVTSAQPAAKSSRAKPSVKTVRTVSESIGLALEHPQSWRVSQTPGIVTLLSGRTELTMPDESKQAGRIVLTISDAGTVGEAGMPVWPKGTRLSAVRDSEKVRYTSPSTDQRSETYLTFVGDDEADAALDGIFVTGQDALATLEPADPAILSPDAIRVWIHFLKCPTAGCENGAVPLSPAASSWDSDGYAGTVRSIISSFVVSP